MRYEDLKVGLQVTTPDTLYRHREYIQSGYRKTWIRHAERTASPGWVVNHPGPRPVEGVIIGVRRLDETGRTYWGYGDEPTMWERHGERRTAVLIAYDLRKAPALAWIEDVKAS